MSADIMSEIKSTVEGNRVVLYMKGSRNMPQCGFSARVVQMLNTLGVEYETVDVLADEAVRQGIKDFSNWPTIPQLYVDGNFVGGCDICEEMFHNGELEKVLTPEK